jgi:hypothetical protein
MGLDTETYWLTDSQSQCDFDFEQQREENGYTAAQGVENSDKRIPVVQRTRERELALEIWIEEDFIVIWSDHSCAKIRGQETDGEDTVKA